MIEHVLRRPGVIVACLVTVAGASLSGNAQSVAVGFASQIRPAPEPIVCEPRQANPVAKYEAAAAAAPQAVVPQLDLAQCYDTAWRFADAARVIARAIDLVGWEHPPDLESARPFPQAPVFAGGHNMPAKVRDADVDYPAKAASDGIRGIVIVEASLDRNGRVRDAKVLESIPRLDPSAISVVKKWRFAPTLVNGQPVEVSVLLPVRFGMAPKLTPADWVDMARVYDQSDHSDAAVQTLQMAAHLEQQDVDRFGAFVWSGTGGNQAASPTRIRHVNPLYPPAALAAQLQGEVIIEMLLDKAGQVGRARVIRSAGLFDAPALAAVYQWTFTPAVVNGQPTSVGMTTVVTFNVR